MANTLPCLNEESERQFFIEVKDKKSIVHPKKNNLLRLREEPKSFRTQYQFQNETQIR